MRNISYSLKDLCREAQVTERTVRYYIQEGLLPPPEGAGLAARYSEQHLLRLRLIRRLKQEYLPLAEIKRRLSNFTTTELENLTQPEADAVELDEEEADAKNYLDRILGRTTNAIRNKSSNHAAQNGFAKPEPSWPPSPAPAAAAKPAFTLAETASAVAFAQTEAVAEVAAPETWQHVTLAPGVVLQYQAGDADLEQQIQQLLAQAQRIFKTNP